MTKLKSYFRPTRAEISLDALRRNFASLRSVLPAPVKIAVCVKGNAYGHGAIEISQAVEKFGVDYLLVAFMDEAIQLRNIGICAPILILGYTPPIAIEVAYAYNIALTIFSEECLSLLEQKAISLSGKYGGQVLKVHVKIDSGMGRLGICNTDEALQFIQRIQAIDGVELEGVFTHFATADEPDKSYANKQQNKFQTLINLLVSKGYSIPIVHASNSAAVMDMPDCHYQMVRIGISLYGLYPYIEVNQQRINLEPVLSLKSAIIYVKSMVADEGVSYGACYRTQAGEYIATVPIGYADGYSRLLSGKAYVLLHGQRVPVVGNICMDQCMISLLPLGDTAGYIHSGEEVVLIGRQGKQVISATEVASYLGTIHYEVIAMLAHRVSRIYWDNGKIVKVSNSFI